MLVHQERNLSKEEHEAILDYVRLRKEGKIEVILCEYGRYYRVGSIVDCWGTKEGITKDRFIEIVELAKVEKKGVDTENGWKKKDLLSA